MLPTHPCRDITLTPRQRIAVYKELYRLRQIDNRTPQQQARLDEMAAIFEYDGQDTCAAGGGRLLYRSGLPSGSSTVASPFFLFVACLCDGTHAHFGPKFYPVPESRCPCPHMCPLFFSQTARSCCRRHVPGEVPREDQHRGAGQAAAQ